MFIFQVTLSWLVIIWSLPRESVASSSPFITSSSTFLGSLSVFLIIREGAHTIGKPITGGFFDISIIQDWKMCTALDYDWFRTVFSFQNTTNIITSSFTICRIDETTFWIQTSKAVMSLPNESFTPWSVNLNRFRHKIPRIIFSEKENNSQILYCNLVEIQSKQALPHCSQVLARSTIDGYFQFNSWYSLISWPSERIYGPYIDNNSANAHILYRFDVFLSFAFIANANFICKLTASYINDLLIITSIFSHFSNDVSSTKGEIWWFHRWITVHFIVKTTIWLLLSGAQKYFNSTIELLNMHFVMCKFSWCPPS